MNETNLSSHDALAIMSIIGGMLLFLAVFFLSYYIYMSICYYKIAKKTNTPDAWFAWIPILDMLLALRIAKRPTWWIIWFFLPFANVIVYALVWMGMAKALRKQEWLGILILISPINLVIAGYLAFSKIDDTPQKPEIKMVNVSL